MANGASLAVSRRAAKSSTGLGHTLPVAPHRGHFSSRTRNVPRTNRTGPETRRQPGPAVTHHRVRLASHLARRFPSVRGNLWDPFRVVWDPPGDRLMSRPREHDS